MSDDEKPLFESLLPDEVGTGNIKDLPEPKSKKKVTTNKKEVVKPKSKCGRPKKSISGLWDSWHDDILELYSVGGSDVEVKAMIYKESGSFSNDLWDRWMKEECEFSETIKMGKLLSESWWKKKGRISLGDKEFSSTLWYMNMKNRFGWSDKQEVKVDAKVDNKAMRQDIHEAIKNKYK